MQYGWLFYLYNSTVSIQSKSAPAKPAAVPAALIAAQTPTENGSRLGTAPCYSSIKRAWGPNTCPHCLVAIARLNVYVSSSNKTINRDCQAVQTAWRIVTVQMIYWAISRSNDWVNRSEDNGFYCGSSFWLHAVSPKSKFESMFRLDSPTSLSLNSTPFFENTFCNGACVWHIWQTSSPGIDPLNWYMFQGVRRGVRAHSVPWRIMIGKYWIALSHFHLACMYLQETCYPLVMGGKLCNLDTNKSKTYSYLELSLYL